MRVASILILIAAVLPALAADQVGTVSSNGAATLRGKIVPGPVQSLPLASGDEVVAGTSPASIVLSDKSSFTAEAKTHLWVERQNGTTVICLSQGRLHFRIPDGGRCQVCALGRPVGLNSPSEGTVTVNAGDRVQVVATQGAARLDDKGSCACAAMPAAMAKTWSTQKKVAVAIGIAGAAGASTAVGLGVAREEPAPLSPSRP